MGRGGLPAEGLTCPQAPAPPARSNLAALFASDAGERKPAGGEGGGNAELKRAARVAGMGLDDEFELKKLQVAREQKAQAAVLVGGRCEAGAGDLTSGAGGREGGLSERRAAPPPAPELPAPGGTRLRRSLCASGRR